MEIQPASDIFYSHIFTSKGTTLEAGFIYKFHISVESPTRIDDATVEGPYRELVGKYGYFEARSMFCVSPSCKVFSEERCEKMILTTNMITHESRILKLTVSFSRVDSHWKKIHYGKKLPARLQALPADFTLVLPEGKEISIHKNVLACSSEFFLKAIKYMEPGCNVYKIVKNEFSEKTWKQAIHFMYHSKVNNEKIDELMELMNFGDQYCMESLCLYVIQSLGNHADDLDYRIVSPHVLQIAEMCLDYYQGPATENKVSLALNDLRCTCERVVQDNIVPLIQNEDFSVHWGHYIERRRTLFGCKPSNLTILGKRKAAHGDF